MSDLKINNITDRTGGSGPVIAGVSTVSSTGAFTVPVGPTEMRGGRGRAIFAGGYEAPANTKEIQKIEIATTGNATDFGDLPHIRNAQAATSSSTRGVVAGGAPVTSEINYTIFSSGGGASHFGSLTVARRSLSAGGDSTRGIWMGGNTPTRQRTIDYVTLASTGDASEFGELGVNAGLANNVNDDMGGCASPIRTFSFGSGNMTNVIQYVTIQTKGDSQDWGDLSQGNIRFPTGVSNSTRALSAGGANPSTNGINTIEYFTMASQGNASNFGDLTVGAARQAGAASATRGVFAGGYTWPSPATVYNVINYVTISTLGNAIDFGDLTFAIHTNGACNYFAGTSDVHGGLG